MVVLTEIQNKNGNINKVVELIDGSVVKKPSAPIYAATGKTIKMELEEVPSYLNDLNSQADKAILLGVWGGGSEFEEYDIQKFDGSENPEEGLISRTKEYFNYANSGATSLMLLDIDGGSDHGTWKSNEVLDFILILETALKDALIGAHASERSNICHFIKPSSGAGISVDGTTGDGAHIYIPVKNLTSTLLEKIFRFAWLNGFQSHLITEAGTVLSRSIVDEAVKGPERLVFESDVTVVGQGLEVVDRPCIWKQGGILDCELACQILDDYIIDYPQKWNAYKKDVEASPSAIKIRQEYIKNHTARLSENGVINASAVVKSRVSGVLLSSDVLVKDDMTSVSVYDVLVDPSAWNEVGGFRDPLEPEYGAGKAKLFTSESRCALHSFAHGSQVYTLKFDSVGLEQWMKNCSDSELEDCFASFLAQSEITPIQEAKIHKEVGRRLGVAVSVVKTTAKETASTVESEVSVSKLIDADATHADIAESMLNTFGQGYRVYGGSLYVFDKTIWNRQSDSSLVRKVGTEYDYCTLCKRASDYKQIVNYALYTNRSDIVEWESEYGFPCASGFYKVCEDAVVEQPYTKELGARFKLGFNPDFEMKTPLWDQFLTNIVNVRCFQQLIGLVLSGVLTPKLQMAGVMKGPGGVGKGTTQKVLTAMLPKDRVKAVKLNEMNDAKIAADLADCVANFIPEVKSDGPPISTEGFKMLTGGDQLRGRRRYSDSFYFKSNASHLISMNKWAALDSGGSEIERRLGHFIIEFVHNHKNVIENLDAQIIQHELPGVLAWAINGVEDWLRNGMDDEHSLSMFSRWTQSYDSVSLFLTECVVFEPRKHVLRSGLYLAYKKFCEESSYTPKKKGDFFDEIRKIKVVSEKASNTGWEFKGLALIVH